MAQPTGVAMTVLHGTQSSPAAIIAIRSSSKKSRNLLAQEQHLGEHKKLREPNAAYAQNACRFGLFL
jgi:hypothetical protein